MQTPPPLAGPPKPRDLAIQRIQAQLTRVERTIRICEGIGYLFVGVGIGLFFGPFFVFNPDQTEFTAWLTASAGPFGFAGFLFVAVANYQQQRQSLLTELDSFDAQDLRDASELKERQLIRERECNRLLDAYLRLQSTLPLFTPGIDMPPDVVTTGAQGFAVLANARRQADAVGSEYQFSPRVRSKLAPFLITISALMDAVDELSDDRQPRFRSLLEALMSEEEREVLSAIQHGDGLKAKALNEWLKGRHA